MKIIKETKINFINFIKNISFLFIFLIIISQLSNYVADNNKFEADYRFNKNIEKKQEIKDTTVTIIQQIENCKKMLNTGEKKECAKNINIKK